MANLPQSIPTASLIAALAKINEQTSATLNLLSQQLSEQQAHKLASLGLAIAESGWHGYESVDAYLRLFDQQLKIVGEESLLRSGEFALKLSGFSFEPAHSYLSLLETLTGTEEYTDQLVLLEQTGLLLHEQYQYASNLVSQYFQTSASILSVYTLAECTAWFKLVKALLSEDRKELEMFLQFSTSPQSLAQKIDWYYLLTLQQINSAACLVLMRNYAALAKLFSGDNWVELQQVLLKMAKTSKQSMTASSADSPSESSFHSLFQSLLESLLKVYLPTIEQTNLFRLLAELDQLQVATWLVDTSAKLPLAEINVCHRWVAEGLSLLPVNPLAAEAFFKLESLTAIELLSNLRGQVAFTDCQRILRLYAEAMLGHPVMLEPQPSEEDSYRDLAGTDGEIIYLPETVAIFTKAEQNFQFYKIAVLHQLGYFEFGTIKQIKFIQDFLEQFTDQLLAQKLFQIIDAARIDWQLASTYRGVVKALSLQKSKAAELRGPYNSSPRGQLLELLILTGLDIDSSIARTKICAAYPAQSKILIDLLRQVKKKGATVEHALNVVADCYQLLTTGQTNTLKSTASALITEEELPEPISFQGEVDIEKITATLEMLAQEEAQTITDDEDSVLISFPVDLKDLNLDDIKKGDVQAGQGLLMTDLDNDLLDAVDDETDLDKHTKAPERLPAGKVARRIQEDQRFFYDEWDHLIGDYRRRWCTLFEIQNVEEDSQFIPDTLLEYRHVSKRVRGQLNRLKPELLRKVKGEPDGDEMDLERAIDAVLDRKSGFTPSENIYVQRQRKDRDVSTLFLLDMSASTDDVIPDPDAQPEFSAEDYEDENFLSHYLSKQDESSATGNRIIDLEKQSVVLMAEALEELGDNYSICGFSGYGRERVDYFLCKDFTDAYDYRAKARIGGIKPCRSTRMGPAIRHAVRSLIKTDSRIQALIIISDGYPQDFDYGQDRSNKDYGVQDTMKALKEARQQGVQTFCLTVDPSGHDYLREMCPDEQYMVIQDITQLPDELSKVYRSLTG